MSQPRTNDDITAALTEALGSEPTALPPTLNANNGTAEGGNAAGAATAADATAAPMNADDEATAEQVLRDAEFALNTLDPTLISIEKLTEAFNNVLLYGGAPVYGANADNEEGGEDEDEDEDLGDAASSKGSSRGEPEPDDDDVLDWDKISENESQASYDEDEDNDDEGGRGGGGGGGRGGAEPVDQEFLDWLNLEDGNVDQYLSSAYPTESMFMSSTVHGDDTDNARPFAAEASAAEADLARLHVSDRDEYIANGRMPERFMVEAVMHNRPDLKHIPLPQQDAFYELTDAPIWVLLQLRKPGYMLSRSSIAAEECRKSISSLRNSPLVRSIATALELMTKRHLEPAHIAVYYQQETQALLDAYYDGRQNTMEDGTVRYEAAFSALTGQRQIPFKEGDYSVFAMRPAVADDVDPLWRSARRTENRQRAIRRPASILLGRLLWQIFDLDMLCHKLERGRLALLLEMQFNNYFNGPCNTILQSTTFQDPTELLFWAQYTKYCARRLAEHPVNRGTAEERRIRAHRNWNIRPTSSIEDLDLEMYFIDLFLPATTYQKNLSNMTTGAGPAAPFAPIATRSNGEDLYAWLTRVGAAFGRDAPTVLKLFVGAFVEQYSKLPLLRKVIYETFLEVGEITVIPVGPVLLDGFTAGPQVYRVAQLLGQNPLLFLRLHQYTLVPAGQTPPVRIKFSVSTESLVEALQMAGCFMSYEDAQAATSASDTFALQRAESFREMVAFVAEQTIPHVRASLLRAANHMAANLSSTELGKLCAEGPYQPTRLMITPFTASSSSWDSSWNVAEALPEPNKCIVPGSARVCAVYLADRTNIATFVLCDENGGVVNHLRWVSCNPTTAEGLQTHRRQCVALLAAIRRSCPNVIAVSTCNERATALFRTLEDFVRDYVWPDLSVNLPVVWAASAAGTVYRYSDLADREMAGVEHAVRYAAATARYVRDPLMELCRYFDSTTRDILRFPLYITQGADEDMVYTHLEREMSLWVSAVGFDLNKVLAQTRPELILQFCAGMGRRKATKLLSFITLCGGVASRQPLEAFFEELGAPVVGENFVATVRVEDLGQRAGEAYVHPCDVTLLPRKWYPITDLFVQSAIAVANRIPMNDLTLLDELCPAAIAWARILELSDHARWRLLSDFRTQSTTLDAFKFAVQKLLSNAAAAAGNTTVSTVATTTNERHLDLILDEMAAMGSGYQRRTYRRIESRVLMKLLTNVSFFTRADRLAGAAKPMELDLDPRELVVTEGDVLECSVIGVQGGNAPAIRVSTSRGLMASIPVTEAEFDNEYMRREFYNVLDEREEARKNNSPFSAITLPDWLRKGEVIYGVVTACNFARCELRLRWCPAPLVTEEEERRMLQAAEAAEQMEMEEGEEDINDIAALRRVVGGAGEDGTSSSVVSSVKSVALNQHALVFRTKASRHALFRNVISNGTIERLLLNPSVEIGEVLIRPVAGHSAWVSLCIKVGTDRIINWPIRECRGRSGNLYYEVPDRRLEKKQLFDSIDHCIFSFVEKLAARISQIRQHRRFYPSVEAATQGIAQTIQDRREALVEESRQFAYAFAETASPTSVTARQQMIANNNNSANGAAGNNTNANGGSNNGASNGSSAASHIPYCVLYWLDGRQRQSPVHVDNEGFYVKLKTVRSATSANGYEWFRASDPETLSFIIKNYASQLHKLNAKAKRISNQNTSLSGRGGSSLNRALSGGIAVAAPFLHNQQQLLMGQAGSLVPPPPVAPAVPSQ